MIPCQLFQLHELTVCLLEERFLVFPFAQGEERALLVAAGRSEFGFGGLCRLGDEEGDAFLVLLKTVTLDFEVENGSRCRDGTEVSFQDN